MRLAADGTVRDSGLPDVIAPSASQHAVEDRPAEAIVYLLGSRYCETDRLSDVAWKLYEKTTPVGVKGRELFLKIPILRVRATFVREEQWSCPEDGDVGQTKR
jgi:hypothetical protein